MPVVKKPKHFKNGSNIVTNSMKIFFFMVHIKTKILKKKVIKRTKSIRSFKGQSKHRTRHGGMLELSDREFKTTMIKC